MHMYMGLGMTLRPLMRPKLSKELAKYSSVCMATAIANIGVSCPSTHTDSTPYTIQYIRAIGSCLRLASPVRTEPHKRLAEILAHEGAIHSLQKRHHHVQDKRGLYTK